MAKRVRDAGFDDGIRALIARKAWRVAAWGALTLCAVGAAFLAAYSETGARRLALGGATATASEPVGQSAARRFDAEIEARRLADAVRALAADRDRLQARISALERNLDDVTGTIPGGAAGEHPANARPGASPLPPALAPGAIVSVETTRAPASPPPASTVAAGPAQGPAPAAAASPGRVASATPAAPDAGAAASTATKTEFGIDIGSAPTVEGLRNLWSSVKGSHEPLLEGLRPVIAVRDGGKPGMIELRLVAGPLANASVAARLCAALAEAGLTCQPAVFDGQRLALK